MFHHLTRHRWRPVPQIDAAMLGLASGLGATASSLPTMLAAAIAQETGAAPTWIVGSGLTASLATWLVLWRRGVVFAGMPRRRWIVGSWALAACGVALLALLPAQLGTWFPLAAAACMAAAGIGSGLGGYVVQNVVLASVDEPSDVAGQAQKWTLGSGVVSTLATGAVADAVDWRWAAAVNGVAVACLAVAALVWKGLPHHWSDPTRRTWSSVAGESEQVQRTIRAGARTYAMWEVAYRLPALMGAGPVAVAGLSAGARLAAIPSLGLAQDHGARRPGRVAALGAGCAAAGTVVLALLGPLCGWWPALGALSGAEMGFNAVARSVKGRLAGGSPAPRRWGRLDDRRPYVKEPSEEDVERRAIGVRRQSAGVLARFAAASATQAALSALWWYLEARLGPRDAAVVIALLAGSQLWLVMRDVPRSDVERARHRIKATGGPIDVAVLAAREGASEHWLCVRAGGHWLVGRHELGGGLICHRESPRGRLRVFQLGRPAWLRDPAVRWSEGWVPLDVPGLPRPGLRFGDWRDVACGEAKRFCDEPIQVSRRLVTWADLPKGLRRKLEFHGALLDHLAADVDPTGAVAWYSLTSEAFEHPLWLRMLVDEGRERGDPALGSP